MRVRALDGTHDWTFGKSQNDYLRDNDAIVQNINTRLNSFLGNCWFDLNAGLDWFNLLSSKNESYLNLCITSVILNTDGVVALLQLFNSLDSNRNFTVEYQVQTVFSSADSAITLNTNQVG